MEANNKINSLLGFTMPNRSPFTPLSKNELVEIVRKVRGTVGDAARRPRDYYLGMCEMVPDKALEAARELGYLDRKKESTD